VGRCGTVIRTRLQSIHFIWGRRAGVSRSTNANGRKAREREQGGIDRPSIQRGPGPLACPSGDIRAFAHSRQVGEPTLRRPKRITPAGGQLDNHDRRLRPGTKDSIAAGDQAMAMVLRRRDKQGIMKTMARVSMREAW
jgi:hypothetical protein